MFRLFIVWLKCCWQAEADSAADRSTIVNCRTYFIIVFALFAKLWFVAFIGTTRLCKHVHRFGHFVGCTGSKHKRRSLRQTLHITSIYVVLSTVCLSAPSLLQFYKQLHDVVLLLHSLQRLSFVLCAAWAACAGHQPATFSLNVQSVACSCSMMHAAVAAALYIYMRECYVRVCI